jgi:glutamate-1-semialdehyde 2,1-aminomutase
MDCLAPVGPVYQAGTLSGNPLATTAGITVLSALKNNPDLYKSLEIKGKQLENGLAEVFHQAGIPVQINRVGSMISIFFNENRVETFDDVQNSDMNLFSAFFHQMLINGVHLPPSGYESWFLATSLTADIIDFTVGAAEKSLKKIFI